MFCSNCGTENDNGVKFCCSCGNSLEKSGVQNSSRPAIWNPNAAANWSILLTPAFGSLIQAKNWKTLNQPGKSTGSMVWFFLTLVVVFASLFIPNQYAMGVAFWYLIIWYVFAGRKQAKFVKKEFGNDYQKKSWVKPILIAIGSIFIYVLVVTMLIL